MKAVVVGSGLAGLVAACRLAESGVCVQVVSFGRGGLQLSQGTFDVLGYDPKRVMRPFEAVDAYGSAHSEHPYALVSGDDARAASEYVSSLVGPVLMGRPGESNLHLPTAVGAIRPTAAAPASMVAGDCTDGGRFVVVGLRRLKDFPASLVAANLERTPAPSGSAIEARHVWIDVEVREGEGDVSALTYARCFDTEVGRRRLAAALAGVASPRETLLLPAVLGLDTDVHSWLMDELGCRVAEIPLPPPGVPGMRWYRRLRQVAAERGVRFIDGARVTGPSLAEGALVGLEIATAGRTRVLAADQVVFAPGGFESGALAVDSYGHITETALGLPLSASDAGALFSGDAHDPQALFGVGVRVDEAMRALDTSGQPVWPNLRVAGGILAGAWRWREKSGEGIAAVSALRAAESVVEER